MNREEIIYLIENKKWKEVVLVGEPATEPLVASLATIRISAYRFVIKALGEIGNPVAVPTLIQFLNSADNHIRCYAINSLGRIGDSRAVQPLIDQLKNPNKYVRREAAKALGNIGDPGAIEPLIILLTHSDKYLKRDAAMALSSINDPRSASSLIGFILNRKPFFRETIQEKIVVFIRLREIQSWALALRENYNWRQ